MGPAPIPIYKCPRPECGATNSRRDNKSMTETSCTCHYCDGFFLLKDLNPIAHVIFIKGWGPPP